MSQSPPIKGVIFDMDDTLIDWSKFDGDWQRMERAHLGRVHDHVAANGTPLNANVEVFVNRYREDTMEAWANARSTLRAPHMENILRSVMERFGYVESDACTFRSCIEAYGWLGADQVTVFPDVPPALEKLSQRDDVKIGLMTNSSQPMTIRYPELENFDLAKCFPDRNALMSAADIGYLKPHPRAFLTVMERLGTTPEETIYVGDNLTADIAGAQGAGLRAVLRVNHPSPPMLSGLIVPDAAINSFDELLLLIDDWDTHATQDL